MMKNTEIPKNQSAHLSALSKTVFFLNALTLPLLKRQKIESPQFSPTEPKSMKKAKIPLVLKERKFQKCRGEMKFFSLGYFIVDFKYELRIKKKFIFTRRRQFGNLLHFRTDSFDHSANFSLDFCSK